MTMIRAALAAALLAVAGPPASFAHQASDPGAPSVPAEVVHRYPHDPHAFTQGLFFHKGRLFESTGKNGLSTLREVRLATGVPVRSAKIDSRFFGEGSTDWGDEIVSLTWTDGVALRWRLADFKPIGRFTYHTEGWGLTHDTKSLILSDGSPNLYFLDPRTFAVIRTIKVEDDGLPIKELNELEYVNGEILANVWMQDHIARIDPATGHVKGWIDCSAIVRKMATADPDAVLNGIAYDAATKRLYVTGKDWPALFEIKVPGLTG